MASLKNTLSSLFHGLDPDLLTGVHFNPTDEEAIRIVTSFNEGKVLLPIFEVRDHLFRLPPEQVGECYCLTKLEPLAKNKVKRTLQDGSGRFWKNINGEKEVVNKKVIVGWVTKLVLYKDKKTPTEWHILVYRDTEPDAGRWVLCQIYKIEKNNGSGSSRGDMNQVRHDEVGQYSNTQFSNAATYAPSGDMVNNPHPFPSFTYSNDGFDPIDWNACINAALDTYSNGGIDTISGFDPDDRIGYLNADLDTSDFDMEEDELNKIINLT